MWSSVIVAMALFYSRLEAAVSRFLVSREGAKKKRLFARRRGDAENDD
jgi:hypothetical protein